MTTTPLDKEILQEIVRVIRSEAKVPHTVAVSGKRYALTYLEDHHQRLVDALASRDPNMLSILFGQLASKVKYQAITAAETTDAQEPARTKKAATDKITRTKKRKAGSTGRVAMLPKARKPSTTTPKTAQVKVVTVGKLRAPARKTRRKK